MTNITIIEEIYNSNLSRYYNNEYITPHDAMNIIRLYNNSSETNKSKLISFSIPKLIRIAYHSFNISLAHNGF